MGNMRLSHRRGVAAIATLATLAVATPAAHADIFATLDRVRPGSTDLDLAKINATTGAGVALPAAVNTPADEVHPAFSPDRSKIVFLRADVNAGTRRVVMMDLKTGQSADLFNIFEATNDPPGAPVFSQDGTKVLTGRKLTALGSSSTQLNPSFTQTDVTNFPNGPFPHQIVAEGPGTTSPGRTSQPDVAGGGVFAFRIGFDDGRSSLVVRTGVTTTISDPLGASLARPTISRSDDVLVFERDTAERKLFFRPLDGLLTTNTPFPALVDAPGVREEQPSFSPDGRFMAFLRGNNFVQNLFVLDTQTQLLLNPQGVSVSGTGTQNQNALHFSEGAIDLNVTPVILNSGIFSSNVVFTLSTNSGIGIIVQRITGTTRFLGRKAPKLKLVGRVPLGKFTKGHRSHRVHWDRKVNGKRLAPGHYLVTVRSVTSKGQVRDLGKPNRVTIR